MHPAFRFAAALVVLGLAAPAGLQAVGLGAADWAGTASAACPPAPITAACAYGKSTWECTGSGPCTERYGAFVENHVPGLPDAWGVVHHCMNVL